MLEAYVFAGFFYFVFSYGMGAYSRWLERRLRTGHARGGTRSGGFAMAEADGSEGEGRGEDVAAIRHTHRAVYDANGAAFDARRLRVLYERAWLERFLAHVPKGGRVLDLGCGAGEPIARFLIDEGRDLVGLDFSATMLALARARFPAARFIEADMRELALGERFSGIVAWDSFFHLTKDEQRDLIPRLAAHLAPGGAFLATVGPDESEGVGRVGDGPVYHASLSPTEYADRFAAAGMAIERFVAEDPSCDRRSVLLARVSTGAPPAGIG